MGTYFLRRLLLLIPTFVGITLVVFLITRMVPGGPIEQAMLKLQGTGGEGGVSGGIKTAVQIPPEALDALRAHYHLDRPAPLAYLMWMGDVLRLDLGTSYKFDLPVWGLLKARFPISLYFGIIGFLLGYLVCIPLGIWKAIKHNSYFDLTSSAIVFVGYSIPGWALGAVLLVLLGGGSFWNVFPLGGFRSEGWQDLDLFHKVVDQVWHTVLPVSAYAVQSFATLTVLMKNSLMENLGADYVRTAFAKGLSERRVIVIHVLRNSLIPIVTGLGGALGVLMAGSFLVERVFNIDGIGYLGYTSIIDRDYAVVMGILVINTLLVLLGNILSDFFYVIVDPRIRFD